MSIKAISSAIFDPIDLAHELGPNGIREIIEIMWIAFHDLKIDNINVSNLDENQITEEWAMRLQKRWYEENRALRLKLSPVTQHEDTTLAKQRGQPPTIDFCFRTWDPDDRYFGAECKNLIEDDNELINRYIITGVCNYLSGRYGSTSSESALIGYIISGSISNIITKISTRLINCSPIKNLSRDLSYDDPHYCSVHIRELDSRNIILHHLMFSFVA
jgi:post-segregation antitoxin (ccd killing protein)